MLSLATKQGKKASDGVLRLSHHFVLVFVPNSQGRLGAFHDGWLERVGAVGAAEERDGGSHHGDAGGWATNRLLRLTKGL